MAVATKRTAKYGGADAQFTTVASPGAALAAYFALIDAALLAAGWTAITSPGSPGPNTYSSTGESGTRKLYIVLETGACTTNAGTDEPGGSYITLNPCQWISGAGAVYGRVGAPRLATAGPGMAGGCLELTASKTWDHAFVCDKDGYTGLAYPTLGQTEPYFWGGGGIAQSCINAKAQFTTASNITTGPSSNVVVTTSADMTAAGYAVGDVVMVIAQNAPASGIYLDQFSTRITAITTTTVTLETVPTLSATISTGALIGDDPQPLWAMRKNALTDSPILAGNSGTYGSVLTSPLPCPPNTGNLWTTQIANSGVQGDLNLAQGTSPAYSVLGNGTLIRNGNEALVFAPVTAPYKEFRSSASGYRLDLVHIWSLGVATSGFVAKARRGSWKLIYGDISSNSNTVPTYGLDLASHNAEYVMVWQYSTMGVWMGPFPKVNATTALYAVPFAPTDRGYVDCVLLETQPPLSAEETSPVPYDVGAMLTDPPYMNRNLMAGDAAGTGQGLIVMDAGPSLSGDDEQPTLVDRPYAFDGLAQGIGALSVIGRAPAPASTLQVNDAYAFTAQYDTGKATPYIYIQYTTVGSPVELVYDGQSFQPGYSVYSTFAAGSGGGLFSIRRDSGWPAGFTVYINLAVPLS